MDNRQNRKISIVLSVCISITFSAIVSLVGVYMGTRGNGHFSVRGWLVSFSTGTIVTLAIGLVIPIMRVARAASRGLKLKEKSIPAIIVEALIQDVIFTPVITFLMVFIARQNAIANGAPPSDVRLGRMFMNSFPACFATGFAFLLIFAPLLEILIEKCFEKAAKKFKDE